MKVTAKVVAERLKRAAGASNYTELGQILGGITPQAISSAISREKIPDHWFDIVTEKSGKTREELTRPMEAAEAGLRLSPAVQVHTTGEPGYQPDQDKRRAWLELCAKNFQVVFDFVADSYGQDAIGIQNFLDDLRDVHHPYRVWRHEQRAGRVEVEKKQTGNDR